MTSSPPSVSATEESSEAILEALLFAVAHDLRSPLLTLSLSAELIRESMPDVPAADGGSTGIALDALKQGAEDLERMLKALTTLSRARRRPLDVRNVPLRMLLGGHVVISDVADVDRLEVVVDPTPLRELIDCLCGEDPAELQVARSDGHVLVRIPARVELPKLDGSPLIELARSLTVHAGTVVEELASLQCQLNRHAVAFTIEDQTVSVSLPVATGSTR